MRKRKFDGLFDSMADFLNLRDAFYAASKGKRDRLAVATFQSTLEMNLFAMEKDLQNETYEFGPYRSFYVSEPKRRLIESARFRDRVVHHAICMKLNPIFFPRFYEYSFACLPGKGTHSSMLTLHKWVQKSGRPYFLKCDIRKYFPSVKRPILLGILKRTLADEKLLRLLEKLILTAPRTGIPIGNLTSQLFANIYLNELDQYVKRELKEPYYVRYMDDFVFLLNSHEEALRLREKIEKFVVEKLDLELSPEKVRIGLVDEGLPFVGYCLRPYSVRVRGASLRRCRKKVVAAYKKSFADGMSVREKWGEDIVRHSLFYRSWSSYVGQTRYAEDSFYLQEKLLNEIEEYSLEIRERRKEGSTPLSRVGL